VLAYRSAFRRVACPPGRPREGQRRRESRPARRVARAALRLREWFSLVHTRRGTGLLGEGTVRARRPLLARESGDLREDL